MDSKPNIPSEKLVSSKEVLDRTGVSRVTLHNYIKRGFIPPPVVGPPPTNMEGTRKIGYFPPDVVERILLISSLKKEGFNLAAIARKLNGFEEGEKSPDQNYKKPAGPEKAPPLLLSQTDHQKGSIKEKKISYQSLAEVPYPGYMVNRRWEIQWANSAAEELFFAEKMGSGLTGRQRNMFRLLVKRLSKSPFKDIENLITVNAKHAGPDIPSPYDDITLRSLPTEDLSFLGKLWTKSALGQKPPLEQEELTLSEGTYSALFCRFREGTLAVYVPSGKAVDPVIELLSDRANLLGTLFPRKPLSLLSICVLVAHLENSPRISADMAVSEYFDLIAQLTLLVEDCCRKYQGKRGEAFHPDRLVGSFLGEAESSYRHILNAFRCAFTVKQKVAAIDLEWKVKKRWSNTICLNIGIHEGREWVGSIPSRDNPISLGDTAAIAEGLSEVGRNGALWTSKHTVSLLPAELQKKLLFGIRRSHPEGEAVLPDTFSRLMDLIDCDKPANLRFVDMKTLSVTELLQADSKLLAESS